jgi:endonuclease/exonuclease/phosphatase family metal-dependent hydrolase
MKITITITIAPLLLSLFLTSIVQPLRALRIVQYNVEWLFIDYNAAADCPGNGCSWKNKTDAEIHLDTVSKNLAEIDPDIVNFCEVQGLDELNQVSQNLNNGLKPYFVKGKDTSTGQNVGLLSKIMPNIAPYRTDARATYPIPGSKCGYKPPSDSPTADTGVSKHSISEFILPELGQTALITAHLLAFPTDPLRCAEREAQATVLHKVIADYLAKGYEVIVMGDFNDYDGTILDSNSDRPLSQVLDILKINGSLTNIAEKIPQVSRFTEWYDANKNCVSTPNEFSMIDHILVSSKIFAHLKNAHIYQNYGEYCGTYQSDHYPVILDLDLEPAFA